MNCRDFKLKAQIVYYRILVLQTTGKKKLAESLGLEDARVFPQRITAVIFSLFQLTALELCWSIIQQDAPCCQ